MSLDLFFRAENKAALRRVVLSTPFSNVFGDLTARDEDGAVLTNEFRQIPGSVYWVFFKAGRVDSWVWLHLRLIGPAEAADLDGVDDQPDRWDRSRLKKWLKQNGTLKTIRGVRVWEYVFPQSAPVNVRGKRVQVWRGSQMEALGLKISEYQGGNSY